LAYAAHWVTPMGAPRRFDTRFFVAVAPPQQTPSHDNSETIGHVWIRPADALAKQKSGEFDMMFATVKTLSMLAGFDDTAALMQHAHALDTVPVHLPRVSSSAKGRRVLIQGDAAYAEVGRLDPAGSGHVSCELLPGTVTRLSGKVRRIAAPNPSFMTGPGTNSYLLGSEGGDIAVIDPGPADAGHIDRLLEAAEGRIRWVLTTHTHMDHSPGAAMIKERTGARLLGMPAPGTERQDHAYAPDEIISHGQRIEVAGCLLQAIHTPGHASNHLCYLLEDERMLFSGDHIMQGSTVVINPPDGDMRIYLDSLQLLKQYDIDLIAPGHGFLIERPHAVVDRLTAHRLGRERKVLAALQAAGPARLETLLPLAYEDVAPNRHAMAARSLLAHLHKLRDESRAQEHDGIWQAAWTE
jgi:glyoxylase-like metal-dependent hydrolase (beta-lactamase superfamily II)